MDPHGRFEVAEVFHYEEYAYGTNQPQTYNHHVMTHISPLHIRTGPAPDVDSVCVSSSFFVEPYGISLEFNVSFIHSQSDNEYHHQTDHDDWKLVH